MKKNSYGMYAIALAIIVVGAFAFGVPVRSLGVFGLVLICPLMMFFMMRGMGGMGSRTHVDARSEPDKREHRDSIVK